MTMRKDHGTVSPTVRITAWLLVSLIAAVSFGGWIAKTEIIARGSGKVIPARRVQAVQPQRDGKVVEILANEGRQVRAGDLLVALDATSLESELQRVDANIQRQRLDAAIAISIISPLTTRDPTDVDFVQLGSTAFRQGNSSSPEEAELVESVLSAVQDEIFQVDAQSNSSVQQQSTQQARIAKARAELEIVTRRFEAIEALRKQGTISEF